MIDLSDGGCAEIIGILSINKANYIKYYFPKIFDKNKTEIET